jgi:DNA-binding response OmpR family regulator
MGTIDGVVPGHRRALIVDDEPILCSMAEHALERYGFLCDAASDGAEAEEKLRATQYDVVLTDLRMPKKHGFALATDLLQDGKRPIIIVVTGVLEPRLARHLLACGVDDIIFKPVDYQILAAKAAALVRRQSKSGVETPG